MGQLNTFLDRLLQYVPEDKKAEARSIYSQASDRATTLESAIEQVQTTATQQKAWWEQNKDAVAERDRLRTELATKQTGGGTPMDQNAIEQAISRVRTETLETGLGLVTSIATIVARHQAEFGEPLDARKLAEDAIAASKPIDQFYAESVAARRQERAEAKRKEELEAARKEGVEAGRKEVMERLPGGALPYPSQSTVPVTTLSGLRKPADGQANPYSLEAAVQTAVSVVNGQQQ